MKYLLLHSKGANKSNVGPSFVFSIYPNVSMKMLPSKKDGREGFTVLKYSTKQQSKKHQSFTNNLHSNTMAIFRISICK